MSLTNNLTNPFFAIDNIADNLKSDDIDNFFRYIVDPYLVVVLMTILFMMMTTMGVVMMTMMIMVTDTFDIWC